MGNRLGDVGGGRQEAPQFTLKMKVVCSFKALITPYKITRCHYNTEEQNLHNNGCYTTGSLYDVTVAPLPSVSESTKRCVIEEQRYICRIQGLNLLGYEFLLVFLLVCVK
jgi:hypothetical protein